MNDPTARTLLARADWGSETLVSSNGYRRVVITGLGAVTPLAGDIAVSWERLIEGRSSAGPICGFDPTGFPVGFACEANEFEPSLLRQRKVLEREERQNRFSVAM